MYLLDTNHCSLIIAGDALVVDRLRKLKDEDLSTCVIVRGEMVYMAEKSRHRAANLARVRAFLSDMRVYGIDDATADIYGQLKAEIMMHFGPREKKKLRRTRIEELGIGENDLWIACIALQHGLTIVSADSDFSRMSEVRPLSLETWAAPPAPASS